MVNLLGLMQDLIETWDTEFDYHDEKELSSIRLARTAYILSKIAELYNKDFTKIVKKSPNFFRDCEDTMNIYEDSLNKGAISTKSASEANG